MHSVLDSALNQLDTLVLFRGRLVRSHAKEYLTAYCLVGHLLQAHAQKDAVAIAKLESNFFNKYLSDNESRQPLNLEEEILPLEVPPNFLSDVANLNRLFQGLKDVLNDHWLTFANSPETKRLVDIRHPKATEEKSPSGRRKKPTFSPEPLVATPSDEIIVSFLLPQQDEGKEEQEVLIAPPISPGRLRRILRRPSSDKRV